MGLIKAAVIATNSVLKDQYTEFFSSDSLGREVLVKRGAMKVKNGSNRGDSEVITTGSRIAVPEGTALLLVDNGQVTDYTTESGLYVWDSSSAPSCLGNTGFLDGAKKSIKELWKRLKAGGVINSEQRVYFVNMLEIFGNKYGTPAPVTYVDPQYRQIYIRLHGEYSYRIVDPVTFFTAVAGNVGDFFHAADLRGQINTEFIAKFTEVLNRCGANGDGIGFGSLPAEQTRLAEYMNQALDEAWLSLRGMVVESVGIGSISPDENSRKRIEDFDRDILLSQNPDMLAARMGASSAEAMIEAGKNPAGAGTAFMGMGMLGPMTQMGSQAGAPALSHFDAKRTATAGWVCACGQQDNSGNFCANCGKKRSVPEPGWTCACGHADNQGKFCSDCGKPKPTEKGGWACACGQKGNQGKFCADCGKPKPEKKK